MKGTAYLGIYISVLALAAAAQVAKPQAELIPAPTESPIVFKVENLQKDETAVDIKVSSEIAEDNGLCRRVETTITFTNPNRRAFAGELEFPIPDGATVCGYSLEVNGIMAPGVVCEKEKARVAFENEKRNGVDPGIVENVKGNIWRTRIYPLLPNQPRKAVVAYVVENEAPKAAPVFERDGDDVFVGEVLGDGNAAKPVADRLREADSASILWDASLSRDGKVAADRNLLECLPENGNWALIVFRDVPEAPRRFTSRAELLKEIDALVYDGGTCFARLSKTLGEGIKFLFTDEIDTLSLTAPDFESDGSIVFASRPTAKSRRVGVRKLPKGEKAPDDIKESKLLATLWAANRIADLASQSGQRKDEFLELGRRYGIAGPDSSLLVLESLEQYLQYKIEPPKEMSFHAEWLKRRAAQDDEIDAEEERAEHRKRLLALWKERVEWWNNPIPPKRTPKSGLFESGLQMAAMAVANDGQDSIVLEERAEPVAARALSVANSDDVDFRLSAGNSSARIGKPLSSSAGTDSQSGTDATSAVVKIAAWDPKTPYLDALKKSGKQNAYPEYLKQRITYGSSPAFFLDCANWFFKEGESAIACRIISNLAEMKLEDAALWRTMGWRLREARAYDFACDVFRHVFAMRGEEAQSKRDLALVLTERGKALFADGKVDAAKADIEEAGELLFAAAFDGAARRSARRDNDMQTSIVALEELNGLLSWARANNLSFNEPKLEKAFRRDMPLDLRIVMSWDSDETDIDIHVLEPDGEEAYYGHRRTPNGGFVSEDVTTGYGPEEYLRKNAEKGVYKILSNYYASHQQQLTGPTVVTATVYTGWGTKEEKREMLSFRLEKTRDKHPIGEVTIK